MKISNNGLLAATWFALSITYMVTIFVHTVRTAFAGGQFAVPLCLDNHLLEDLPIPVAGVVASFFLGRHSVWPRVVLGLASGGLIFVIWMMMSTTAHHKPYAVFAVAFGGCVWTLISVTRGSQETEPTPGGDAQPARRGSRTPQA
ncbi:MAG: hypothetical protein FJ276_32915 [Planctomycetes bacterium]|nr:hypothetical protein [Planctomycetota bacterium]